MAWLQENWFWLLVLVLFVGMHMGHGHGGHGGRGGHEGHGGRGRRPSTDPSDGDSRGASDRPKRGTDGGGDHAEH